jgi:5'-methylthioadenosine phosphorylase
MSAPIKIGVLGGSGLYELEGFTNAQEVPLSTPFGDPSDAYVAGELDGTPLVFLPRHGRGHRLNPSEINYRANIWGMKALGVTHIVSVSAVGSMREEIVPGDFVVIDQFVDRTRHRKDTFFGDGCVAHVQFADPVCSLVRKALLEASASAVVKVHDGGTYLCMEGPQFSTRAESNLYRSWGMDVIGMTNLTEAKLAREAEMCYATVAMSTDYDCWHEGHDDVTVDGILEVMAKNVAGARSLLRAVIEPLKRVANENSCTCGTALSGAILTHPDVLTDATRARLGLLLERQAQSSSS